MDKRRLMPVVAGAAVVLSLTACQGMMGGRESSQTSSAPAAAGTASSGQQAMSSDLVRDVQRGLAARGYDTGPQDGIYGDSTEQALRRFQRDQRLTPSGQVDGQTLAALGVMGGTSATASNQRTGTGSGATASREYVPTSRRQGAMASPTGARIGLNHDQVRSLQQTLADRGYDPGQADGRWGRRTQQAVRDFQRDQNIQGNGRPDARTLAALGMESGAPATQTGQLPAEGARNRGTDLPPAGSQAPGSAPETERSTINPGGAPDTRNTPPD